MDWVAVPISRLTRSGSISVTRKITPAPSTVRSFRARPFANIDASNRLNNPVIRVTKGRGKPGKVAYGELAGDQNIRNYFVTAATERYRYPYDKEINLPCELFDLEKDPDELQNLVNEPGHAGIRKDMHKDYVLPFGNS